MPPACQSISYHRYRVASGWDRMDGKVVAEASVALTVNGETWLSFACTPSNLDALAAGFLYNEGIIQNREEIAIIEVCKQGFNVDVWLKKPAARPEKWQRTSGCIGGYTAARLVGPALAQAGNARIEPEALLNCMDQLLEAQDLYRETGGIHTSTLSDGRAVYARAEDIGRHNTLDKLAGRVLLDEIHIHPVIISTTGRVSSDMLQKSARLDAAAVISRTSPTSQSVAMAEQLGIILVGYARRDGFLVYTHAERLESIPGGEQVPRPRETLPAG